MPSSRGSSGPRDQTQVSCIAGRFFTVRATRGVPCGLLQNTTSSSKLSGEFLWANAPPEHLTVHPETRDTVVPPPAPRGSLPASFSPAWTCTSQTKREHHSPRLCVLLGPQLQQDGILNVPKGTVLTKEGHLTKPSKR